MRDSGGSVLTAERARELLSYNLDTGVVVRLVRTSNNTRVGDIVGWLNGKDGYLWVMLDGCNYPVHRVVWLWMKGEWPAIEIDHINLDKIDNRWRNLREATRLQNEANKPALSNNTSGFKGVGWDKRRRKWRADISINGTSIRLGRFDTAHQAYAKYCLAARKRHGDYARVYEADQLIIPAKVFEERVLRNLRAATQRQFEEA